MQKYFEPRRDFKLHLARQLNPEFGQLNPHYVFDLYRTMGLLKSTDCKIFNNYLRSCVEIILSEEESKKDVVSKNFKNHFEGQWDSQLIWNLSDFLFDAAVFSWVKNGLKEDFVYIRYMLFGGGIQEFFIEFLSEEGYILTADQLAIIWNEGAVKPFHILRAHNQNENTWWNRCKDFAINNDSQELLSILKEFESSMSYGPLDCDDELKQTIYAADLDINGSSYLPSASFLESA